MELELPENIEIASGLDKEQLAEVIASSLSRAINFISTAAIESTMGTPSAAQFDRIVQFLDADHGTTAEDWFTVSILASDNLVARSIRAWHPNVLKQMAELYPGSPLQLNHEWDESKANIGFVYGAKKQMLPLPQEALTHAYRGPLNKSIADAMGFHALILDCAIPAADVETVQSIKTRIYDCISTGGYLTQIRLICPDCSAEKGREVTFTERDKNGDYVCPHLIPSVYTQLYDDDEADSIEVASYLILDGIYDAVEVSYVVAGDLPLARTIRRRG